MDDTIDVPIDLFNNDGVPLVDVQWNLRWRRAARRNIMQAFASGEVFRVFNDGEFLFPIIKGRGYFIMGRQYHNIEREMTFEERNEYIMIFSRIHLRKQAQYDWVMGLVDRLNLDTVRHILSMEQLEHVPLFISVIY